MVKLKCKFRIKVGKKYTYTCENQEIEFINKDFEELDDTCRFFRHSLMKAKKNKINPDIIKHLESEIKKCDIGMQSILLNEVKNLTKNKARE